MLLRDFAITRLIHHCLAAFLVLSAPGAAAQAWEFAHGDRDNSGFANVVTAPAKKAPITVPGLGSFKLGAGPVVAPDGTVYLGTRQGKLIALHANGSPFWSRDITPGQTIVASPAIASDGSIYVIGVRRVRDSGDGRVTSTLHHFNSGGAWLNQIAFPEHEESGPRAYGPPNIWRSGGAEAIMVPAFYRKKYGGGHSLRLIAFSLGGQVLDDTVVISITPQVVGGSGKADWELAFCMIPPAGCALGMDYAPTKRAEMFVRVPPMSGVGIFTFAGGGTPFILVSDHYKDLVGYIFSGQRFTEAFRVHEEDFFMRTPPMILADGHTLIGLETLSRDEIGAESATGSGRIIFAKPNGTAIQPVKLVNVVQAAPTRMADGRVALVDGFGNVIILKDGKPFNGMTGAGRSIASAAASRTHIFVSGENGFVTFDATTPAEVARIDWVGGGLNPPAIGPKGHVYAIASNILFVFPPPKQRLGGATVAEPGVVATDPSQPTRKPTLPGSGATATGPGTVATDPGPPTAQPSSQTYKPPLTVNGNRLFACEELDQDDCGKGDYRSISTAFCQTQGYAEADDIDVDSRKVKAETLNGQFCSKNKCKVFDKIVCKL